MEAPMSGDSRKERDALRRIADLMVEDILNAPDEEILAEAKQKYGDADRSAAHVRAALEKSVISSNKSRLAEARAGAAAIRSQSSARVPISIALAREKLREIAAGGKIMPQEVTLAARKESELSDADILSMIDDLRELGVLSEDEGQE
jgi:hypothetical protein